MLENLKAFSRQLNEHGFPIPFLTDPKTGKGSVSLTLLVVSFNVVLVGLVGKWANFLGGIDLTQALYLYGMSASLYYGRSFTKRKNSLNVDKKETE